MNASGEATVESQLRFGVVMTGGVSLAVWMGGTALELDRMRRSQGAYGQLLRAAGVQPVVDIVSGTSAGGLNGTLLATATAWNSTLDSIRDVWINTADLDRLLRPTGEKDPPSLLQGDSYFLGAACDAISRVKSDGQPRPRPAGRPPLHLMVTSTVIGGQVSQFSDSLGEPVRSRSYLGLYQFTEGAVADGEHASRFDDPHTPARLARAARSSASFPVAFEPSQIDFGKGANPDMAPAADFTPLDGATEGKRWVLDGGLVLNEPVELVYDRIRAQPSAGPVRRVLCYVSPLSGAGTPETPPPDQPPDLLGVITGTINIPREQNIVRQLREITRRDRDQRTTADARRTLLDHDNPRELLDAARALKPILDARRGEEAVEAYLRDEQRRSAVVLDGATRAGALYAAAETIYVQQTLLLVQDLLRRAVVRVSGDDRDRLVACRLRVSNALANLTDGEEARRATAHAMDVLAGAFIDTSTHPARAVRHEIDRLAVFAGAARETPDPSGEDSEGWWRAFGALDVLLSVTSQSLTPQHQRIDLVQMSAYAPNAFDGRDTPERKLTGIQFNHFGAFYRSSWRANDWMWGRLDGAYRLIELLADPEALLLTHGTPGVAAEALQEIIVGTDPATQEWLRERYRRLGGKERVAELLRNVQSAQGDDRREMVIEARRGLACLLAARVQLEILIDELPTVRRTVLQDQVTGSALIPRDQAFVASMPAGDAPLTPAQAIAAFHACTIGDDRLADEIGSDRLTNLASRGAAVAAGALGAINQASFVRPILGAARSAFRISAALSDPTVKQATWARTIAPAVGVLVGALAALWIVGDRELVLLAPLGIAVAVLLVSAAMYSLTQAASAAVCLVATTLGLTLVASGAEWATITGLLLAAGAGLLVAGAVFPPRSTWGTRLLFGLLLVLALGSTAIALWAPPEWITGTDRVECGWDLPWEGTEPPTDTDTDTDTDDHRGRDRHDESGDVGLEGSTEGCEDLRAALNRGMLAGAAIGFAAAALIGLVLRVRGKKRKPAPVGAAPTCAPTPETGEGITGRHP